MEWSSSLEADSRSVTQENLPLFMEPEGSLPCSQQPAASNSIKQWIKLCNPNLGSEYWEPILRGPSLTL
jgi:hypothetical protein